MVKREIERRSCLNKKMISDDIKQKFKANISQCICLNFYHLVVGFFFSNKIVKKSRMQFDDEYLHTHFYACGDFMVL